MAFEQRGIDLFEVAETLLSANGSTSQLIHIALHFPGATMLGKTSHPDELRSGSKLHAIGFCHLLQGFRMRRRVGRPIEREPSFDWQRPGWANTTTAHVPTKLLMGAMEVFFPASVIVVTHKATVLASVARRTPSRPGRAMSSRQTAHVGLRRWTVL